MELIRRYLSQIKAQLTGLTVSQKLLIGLLAVVMIATVFFTVMFSAKPQMVPLISQPMNAEQINKVDMALKGKYTYQISGDKILVPTEQAYEIRGLLGEMHALPEDLRTSIGDMIAASSAFTTERMNSRAYTNAVQMELSKILMRFSYLSSASVIIAQGEPPTLGRQPLPTTAAVYVKTREDKDLSQSQVMAVADLVSSAVAALKRENVSVIVNGLRTYHVPSGDTAMPADLVEYKKTMEDYYMQRLAEFFREIGDVKIAINVVPDLTTKKLTSQSFDKPVGREVQNTQHTLETSEGSGVGGEPGVTPNTTISVSDSGTGKRNSTTSNDSTSKTDVRFPYHTEEVLVPAGVETKEMTASLSFPRSYFVSIFRRQKNDPKADPQDAELQPIIDEKLKAIALQAKAAIGLKNDDQIRVDWYDDMLAAKQPELILASTGLGSLGGLGNITQYARQGVLAIVAIGVLGMMLMMVRRAVPAGADDETDPGLFFGKKKKSASVEQFDSSDDVFGEANESDAVLTGIELDDETLQSRKMVDEVSAMIKENPENAAALVKRWMTKNK